MIIIILVKPYNQIIGSKINLSAIFGASVIAIAQISLLIIYNHSLITQSLGRSFSLKSYTIA
jgi:hypothetical protein